MFSDVSVIFYANQHLFLIINCCFIFFCFQYLRGHINTVVLTGWQRYFHDGPLCELLPVGIPTMVHQLQYLRDWDSVSPAISKHNVMVSTYTVVKGSYYFLKVSYSNFRRS